CYAPRNKYGSSSHNLANNYTITPSTATCIWTDDDQPKRRYNIILYFQRTGGNLHMALSG
ncbi:hypothetical protein ACJMK2_025223, partial [Sinanodonta woodiana]